MQTSNFARAAKHPQAVAISVGVPPWYRGRRYLPLAPDREWLDLPPDEYTPLYKARLDALDPQQVAQALGEDAVLLCWEAPDKFCHRFLVAWWLEASMGIDVPELGATQRMMFGEE